MFFLFLLFLGDGALIVWFWNADAVHTVATAFAAPTEECLPVRMSRRLGSGLGEGATGGLVRKLPFHFCARWQRLRNKRLVRRMLLQLGLLAVEHRSKMMMMADSLESCISRRLGVQAPETEGKIGSVPGNPSAPTSSVQFSRKPLTTSYSEPPISSFRLVDRSRQVSW